MINHHFFGVTLEGYPYLPDETYYYAIEKAIKEVVGSHGLTTHVEGSVDITGGKEQHQIRPDSPVFGITEALVAINNTIHKHDGLLNPVHEYILKQAVEALGKMHDGGLT